MRAYAEETNRLNRERRSSGDTWKAELVKIEKQICGIIQAIKAGMFHESMKAEMDTLEAHNTELNTLLVDAPADTPDIVPSASAIYAKKVSALTKALNRKKERQEAAETLRGLIKKIVLTPGQERGEIYATLHGELAAILEWTVRQAIGKSTKKLPEMISRECLYQWLRVMLFPVRRVIDTQSITYPPHPSDYGP